MLKRQNKIFAFLVVILLIWLWVYNERFFIIANRIQFSYNAFFYSTDYPEYSRNYTLPDLWDEINENVTQSKRPWYLFRGTLLPKPVPENELSINSLFPDPKKPFNDRIEQQLMYIPPDYDPESQHKLVLMYDYIGSWLPHSEGSDAFKECPVSQCIITTHREEIKKADAVIFGDKFIMPPIHRSPNQIWMMYTLESPYNTRSYYPSNMFNWSINYRLDSTIPTPYGKWMYHGDQYKRTKPLKNFAKNKTKHIAWFASNCDAKNLRFEYAMELSKHISVDIFGRCGRMKCPRSNPNYCYELLANRYKFYLAFENSNCKYYITEKLFRNALRNSVIPIVMGARKADYENLAPKGSFIHVDDFNSPKELASYLDSLDKNDTLYNQYFLWRGTGEFYDDRLFCRICTLLHSKYPKKYYNNINRWWKMNHACSAEF